MWRYASLKALLALSRDIAGGDDDDETDPSFTHHQGGTKALPAAAKPSLLTRLRAYSPFGTVGDLVWATRMAVHLTIASL